MIEAVSTSVANNASNRPETKPVDAGRSQPVLEAPEKQAERTVSAPFISPVVQVDVDINQAVLVIRNSETGEVEGRLPSKRELEAFDRSKGLAESQPAAEGVEASAPQGAATSGQATGNAGATVGTTAIGSRVSVFA